MTLADGLIEIYLTFSFRILILHELNHVTVTFLETPLPGNHHGK